MVFGPSSHRASIRDGAFVRIQTIARPSSRTRAAPNLSSRVLAPKIRALNVGSPDQQAGAHTNKRIVRRCPTLPHPPECSTIGAVRLSYRVRNGTGRFPNAMTTETTKQPPTNEQGVWNVNHTVNANTQHKQRRVQVSHRPISTSQLHTLPRFHIWPINPVIYRGPPTQKMYGYLISKQASRLDAFSGYPFPT